MNEIWTSFIYPFLSLIALGFIYFTIKKLLPSYFAEKGKNIATKEDIGEITKLVEKAKLEFIKETEILKYHLRINSDVQIDLITEERNAIVECNECFSCWLHLLVDSNLGGTDNGDNRCLNDYRQKINLNYHKFLLAESRFNLFIEDDELKEALSNLKIITLAKLGSVLLTYTNSLEIINQEKLELKAMNVTDSIKEYYKIIEKEKIIIDEASQNIINGFKHISPMQKLFQQSCRKYLYEVFNKTSQDSSK